MDELKPCPFCGEQPHITEGHLPAYWYVDCGNVDCHAQPSVSCRSHLGRVEVINQWNTRTDPKLEALREAAKRVYEKARDWEYEEGGGGYQAQLGDARGVMQQVEDDLKPFLAALSDQGSPDGIVQTGDLDVVEALKSVEAGLREGEKAPAPRSYHEAWMLTALQDAKRHLTSGLPDRVYTALKPIADFAGVELKGDFGKPWTKVILAALSPEKE